MAVTLSTEEWTSNYTKESLTYELATTIDYLVNEYGEYLAARPYYDQARYLIHKIAVYNPRPTFKIYLNHLGDKLKQQLEGYDKRTLVYILKQAVGQIFEDIDSRYYHNSVANLLDVELVE